MLLDEDGSIREAGARKDLRRLEFSAWLLAWDRYAMGESGQHGCACVPRQCAVCVGAAVLRQLSFKTAMKHKLLVAEVACSAKSMDKWPILGVLFDEVCR